MTDIHQVNSDVPKEFDKAVRLAHSCSVYCISDLDYTLKSSSTGKIVIDREEISAIMFADELVYFFQ